jgi:hypothetical protein
LSSLTAYRPLNSASIRTNPRVRRTGKNVAESTVQMDGLGRAQPNVVIEMTC